MGILREDEHIPESAYLKKPKKVKPQPIIYDNPVQKGIKRIIFFPPDTKCPKEKK